MRTSRRMHVALALGCLLTNAGAQEAQTVQEEAGSNASAQERSGAVERVLLRVTAGAGNGRVIVDRGSRDGVQEGDRVFLRPRSGNVLSGRVVRADDRTSEIELHERGVEPTPGTRGEVLIPAARIPERIEPSAPAREDLPEHPPWADPDDEWTEDQPLLAEVHAVRPEERAIQFSGRAWTIFDGVISDVDDRTFAFGRIGTEAQLTNGFGRGGTLHIYAEADYRDTFVEDQVDNSDGYQRFERLSYVLGGTRFERERWEMGRFLLNGMPEFGIIDGVEYSRRLAGGDTVGGSMGWMPEPDGEMASGHDFQISGFYRWVADATERLTIDGGYQKTFHQTTADRDLLVGKITYLPAEGWDLNGTVWVDVYDGRDEQKDGVELTQAFLSTSKRWESGRSLDLTYSRISFPELQRREFLPPFDLANARNDRLALSSLWPTGRTTRLRGQLGIWQDEEDDGGDAQVGIETDGLFALDGRAGLSLVASEGAYSKFLAARISYNDSLATGRWGLQYEASHAHQFGFNANNDELYAHWLRATRDWHLAGGWDLAVNADARFWENDKSLALGIYLQRRFY